MDLKKSTDAKSQDKTSRDIAGMLASLMGGGGASPPPSGEMIQVPTTVQQKDGAASITGKLPDDPALVELPDVIPDAAVSAAVESGNIGELPFAQLHMCDGRALVEKLKYPASRKDTARRLLASQVRDALEAAGVSQSVLFNLKQKDVAECMAKGKGTLQNALALKLKCDSAARASLRALDDLDRVTYGSVSIGEVKVGVVIQGGSGCDGGCRDGNRKLKKRDYHKRVRGGRP